MTEHDPCPDIAPIIEWAVQSLGEGIVLQHLALDPRQLDELLAGNMVADTAVKEGLSRLTEIAKKAGLGEPPPPVEPPASDVAKSGDEIEPVPPPEPVAPPVARETNDTTPIPRARTRDSAARLPALAQHELEVLLCMMNELGSIQALRRYTEWEDLSGELAMLLLQVTILRKFGDFHSVQRMFPGSHLEQIQWRRDHIRELREIWPDWTQKIWHSFFGGGPIETRAVLKEVTDELPFPYLPDFILFNDILEAGSDSAAPGKVS